MMKKIKLSKIIHREYFKSIVYPLLAIEMMLLIAYFWSNYFVNKATEKILINETQINLQELSQRSAKIINDDFKSISDLTRLYSLEYVRFFERYDPKRTLMSDPFYRTISDGVIVNTQKNPQSCTLFYSNVRKENPDRLNKAIASESTDVFTNSLLKLNPNIAQLYFNSHDSMNRLCPFMEDALGQYPHDINIPIYNFYYLADLKHNPDKKVVWTDAYLDPAGKGWMISAIAPVYKKDFLEGVVGIDVTLENILNNLLSIKFPYTSYSMLVDQEGNILAMSQGLEPHIGIKELTTYDYEKPIEQTISKPKDFNLMKSNRNDLTKTLGTMVSTNQEMVDFDTPNSRFLITQNTIHETGWKLIVFVDKNSLLASTTELKQRTDTIGYAILAGMVLFYLVFIFLIFRRSSVFSEKIILPLKELIDATEELKTKLAMIDLKKSNIQEIDTLIDNFTLMGHELRSLYYEMQSKIDEGIRKNAESQKMIIHQSRLAAMGEMISMIAHQWRQPISAIAMEANNILLDIELGEMEKNTVHDSIERIVAQTMELSATIDDFRNFFKPDQKSEPVVLSTIMKNLDSVIGSSLKHADIAIEYEGSEELKLTTYSRELMQVLINIVKNAKDAFEKSTQADKQIRIAIAIEENNVMIEICDNAGGIDEAVISSIFEPYFSTKNEKNGTGLGLFISKMIIEKHMFGRLEAYNQDDGACFKITIPSL